MENEKIVLRNLQQQVGKNKDDIQALSQGIKIRGFGENVPEDLKPGESWLKGTGPYELIVMTDGGQINLGQWPAKGPQGIPGPKGEGAELGHVSTETTTLEPGLNAYVDVVKDGENLNFRFEIPQGERGIQGLKGETGPKGDTGPQGPQGPQGEARAVSEIVGTLESAAALPSPSTVPSYYAYLVGKENDYTVYAIVGGVWKDIGNFTAIQGPQGPKGDSYGTFTKTVKNGKEMSNALSDLTDTQSVVGAYATSGNKRTELAVLAYNRVEMIYAWASTAEEAPYEPTAATWQAVVSPEGEARFPVNDNYVDSITLYIYDSSKSLMDKVSFLKLDDDGILPQSTIPRYASLDSIPKNSSSLKVNFGTGSFNLINGLVLDCFAFIGTQLYSMKINGDAENEIYMTDATPVGNGAIISMANGSGTYDNYQVLVDYSDTYGQRNIWDYLYPMNCRFKFYVSATHMTVSNMKSANLDFTAQTSPEYPQYNYDINIKNCKDMHIDCHDKDSNGTCLLKCYGLNCSLMPMQTMITGGYERPITSDREVSQLWIHAAKGSETTIGAIAFNPLKYSTFIYHLQEDPRSDSSYMLSFIAEDKAFGEDDSARVVTTADGSKIRVKFEPIIDISPSGKVSLDGKPYYVPYTEPAPTMAKARAMSVEPMSLQSEPIKPNVPDDAIGIFSVDEQGNTIDAMTGERI